MDTSESNDQGDAVDGPGGSGMTSEAKASGPFGPHEIPKASGPKAPGTPGPHEMLRHALQSFDEGTPEFQAANMFLRYMEGSGLLPPCPEGQVSKKVM
jgi:hypothetical protein